MATRVSALTSAQIKTARFGPSTTVGVQTVLSQPQRAQLETLRVRSWCTITSFVGSELACLFQSLTDKVAPGLCWDQFDTVEDLISYGIAL